jgi:hypothetical protein
MSQYKWRNIQIVFEQLLFLIMFGQVFGAVFEPKINSNGQP